MVLISRFMPLLRIIRNSSIYALASGTNQRSGVAVVRLSGRESRNILEKLTNKSSSSYEPRKMYFRDLWHPVNQNKIDKSLVVWFKEPNSFTGEDVCEFHIHGGPAVITSLLNALSTFDNLRHAEPGEFSRRAFLNGKMDLVEIEGLADLVNAETELQLKQALNQMEGSLSKLYKQWREDIIKCLANVEAFIDFHEEENIEDGVMEQVESKVKKLIESIEKHLNDNRKGERLRNGVKVVIVGKSNAGKSSLLNKITDRPAAIVSDIPGTTRDIIETAINISGYPILLSDTAGLRYSNDKIEIEGVKRALDRVESADIIVILIDLQDNLDKIKNFGMKKFLDEHLKDQMDLNKYTHGKEIIICLNKKDLVDLNEIRNVPSIIDENKYICKVSCLNDIDELLEQLKHKLQNLCTDNLSEMPSLTQQRHRDNLSKCVASLKSYLKNSKNSNDLALNAEELRQAAKWLGTITGHVTSENILDVIFRDFCIGK